MAIGNIAPGFTYGYSVPQMNVSGGGGGSGNSLDTLLGNTLNNVSGIYGSQNAAEAQNKGILAGIDTQNKTMGNINSLYSTQLATGNNAMTALGKLQGVGGGAPDYSGFENTPGYQFAVQQGLNAIRSGAAANGAAYSPTTLANIGQFVTGTASQNYNNYVQQLLQTAGLGAQANNTLTGANLTTGGNISQLQQNSGNAEASGMAGASSGVGSLLSGLLGNNGLLTQLLSGGTNGSGVIGAIGSGLNKLFGGGSSNGTVPGIGGFGNYSGYSSDPNAGNYIGNVGNVDGSSIVDQYANTPYTGWTPTPVDPGSLSNPYGNLDFSDYNFDTGESGNP